MAVPDKDTKPNKTKKKKEFKMPPRKPHTTNKTGNEEVPLTKAGKPDKRYGPNGRTHQSKQEPISAKDKRYIKKHNVSLPNVTDKRLNVTGLAHEEDGTLMTKPARASQGLYEKWTTPYKIAVIRQWRRDGLSQEQVAANMGISHSTLKRWGTRNAELKDAYRNGKIEAIAMVESRFFANAVRSKRTQDQVNWLRYNHRSKYYEEAPHAAPGERSENDALNLLLDRLNENLSADDKTLKSVGFTGELIDERTEGSMRVPDNVELHEED